MATRDVSASAIGAVLQADYKRRREAVSDAVYEAALAGWPVLEHAAPKDTGHLKQSFHVERVGASGAEIIADAPYAAIVELGSRPHRPPHQPILDWVNRHPDLIRDGETADGVARMIEAKIAREGTRPTYFVKGQLPHLRAILKTCINAALAGA